MLVMWYSDGYTRSIFGLWFNLSDINNFKDFKNPLVISTAIHQTNAKYYLWYLFIGHNVLRLCSILALFIVATVNFVRIKDSLDIDQGGSRETSSLM